MRNQLAIPTSTPERSDDRVLGVGKQGLRQSTATYETAAANGNATTLVEPCLADVIAAIRADPNLDSQTKNQWLTGSLRIAAFLDRPPEVIPARIMAIRQAVAKLVAARCGISEKSLATYKSALRAALIWYAEKANVPARGTPLDGEWATLIPRDLEPPRSRQSVCLGAVLLRPANST
jgi:hypothetical protein